MLDLFPADAGDSPPRSSSGISTGRSDFLLPERPDGLDNSGSLDTSDPRGAGQRGAANGGSYDLFE